ncbi:hypothetical protein MJO29_008349 [Puccinia striiformis f. sp. tritici]|nr:hypothetical protein MJO29_008349 [Puccinia striiformis f. sp. tritici]
MISLRIVLARISILIFKTPRYTSIIKSICLLPAEQAVYDRDMQPFVKNAIEAIPKLTLSNFTVWKANFETLAPVAEVEPRDDFHEDVPSAAASSNGDFHDCSSDEDVQLTPISTDSQAIPASSRVLRERTDKVKPLKYSHLTESVKKIASSDPKSFGKAINSPDGKASLRIVLARISILIFKTPRYTSIIKSICSGFGYKL